MLATTLPRVNLQKVKTWGFGSFVLLTMMNWLIIPLKWQILTLNGTLIIIQLWTGRYVDLPRLTLISRLLPISAIILGKPADLTEYLFMTMVVGNGMAVQHSFNDLLCLKISSIDWG